MMAVGFAGAEPKVALSSGRCDRVHKGTKGRSVLQAIGEGGFAVQRAWWAGCCTGDGDAAPRGAAAGVRSVDFASMKLSQGARDKKGRSRTTFDGFWPSGLEGPR